VCVSVFRRDELAQRPERLRLDVAQLAERLLQVAALLLEIRDAGLRLGSRSFTCPAWPRPAS
jgi:hypothetical protein